MNRDIKQIYSNYRLIKEQAPSTADLNQRMSAGQQVGQPSAVQMQQQNPSIVAVLNAVKALTNLDETNKQALISFISSPEFERGYESAREKISAPQNVSPSTADLNQRANAEQQVGQPTAAEMRAEEDEFLHGPGGTPNSQTSNYGNINDLKNAEKNKGYIDYPGRKW